MNTLNSAWAAYSRLQKSISRRQSIDDYAFGLEAGLNRLIELQSDPSQEVLDPELEAARAVASGRRGSCRRRHLCAEVETAAIEEIRLSADAGSEAAIIARQQLRLIAFQTDETERAILFGTAMGHDSASVAARFGIKSASLRKRLDRLRGRLAA